MHVVHNQKCGSCKWFEVSDSSAHDGECCFDPPSVFVLSMPGTTGTVEPRPVGVRPPTKIDSRCHNWCSVMDGITNPKNLKSGAAQPSQSDASVHKALPVVATSPSGQPNFSI